MESPPIWQKISIFKKKNFLKLFQKLTSRNWTMFVLFILLPIYDSNESIDPKSTENPKNFIEGLGRISMYFLSIKK
jgi:hypothetical protein